MANQKTPKSLSDVFRELEQNKNKQVEDYKTMKKQQEQESFLFHVKQRTKMDNIKLVVIVLVVLLVFSLFSSNYIFATDFDDTDMEKVPIGEFEKNENPKDVYSIMSENMSSTYQKEIFDREEEISFETEYIPNKDMPEGEENIVQEGIIGSKIVTYVRSFENNQITEENAIGESVINFPQTEKIEVGTSKILKIYNIHIGDKLYVSQNIELRKEASMEAESLIIVPQYYDVKTLEIIQDSWVKVSYSDKTGYILCDYLTSETLTPAISEMCRKAKILNKIDFNMQLNEPSGLSLEDYKKLLSNQAQDTNNVFKENYKAFYDAENKYGINGVFLVSIAIHESNWGKSTIAKDKHNLFGFGAYDATPYESAVTFTSFAEGIDTVAAWLVSNYLNGQGTSLKNGQTATGRYFNGATVTGVNVRYASDPNWATKVFATMEKIYAGL